VTVEGEGAAGPWSTAARVFVGWGERREGGRGRGGGGGWQTTSSWVEEIGRRKG
jgi:hypothetical protein